MAIAQNTFDTYAGDAFEGQIATEDRPYINTGIAEDTIWFGRAVVRGSTKRHVKTATKTSKAADVVGFSVRTGNAMSYDAPYQGNGTFSARAGYFKDNHISYLRTGVIAALCVDGAKAGDTVSVITDDGDNQGALTHGKGVELNLVKWRDDVQAGKVGWIEVNGVFATPSA